MKLKKNGATEQKVCELAAPLAQSLGLEIWDVRFEKEGASWYLRVFIDKEGGLSIDACEAMSRPLSDLLDEADPIDQQYFLEVGSAGLERELVRESHFAASIGAVVRMRLIRPDDAGQKEYIGALESFDRDGVRLVLEDDTVVTAPFANIAHIKWHEDF